MEISKEDLKKIKKTVFYKDIKDLPAKDLLKIKSFIDNYPEKLKQIIKSYLNAVYGYDLKNLALKYVLEGK